MPQLNQAKSYSWLKVPFPKIIIIAAEQKELSGYKIRFACVQIHISAQMW